MAFGFKSVPCYYPIKSYRSRTVNPSGKRSLVFKRELSLDAVETPLPCGRCIGCRLERARQWAMRCLHETKCHKHSRFVTLTYDDDHLPKHGVLVKRDLQLFMKRLRFAYGDQRIRFYGCGEYGTKGNRPHYHLLLFGQRFEDERKYSWNERGEPLFRSGILERLWPVGKNVIGDVTFDSACYVASYCVQKVSGDREKLWYQKITADGEVIDMPREFTVMSRRPGIGRLFFEKFGTEIYDHDSCIVNGKEVRPPRYYDNLMSVVDEALIKRLKDERKLAIDVAENTPTRRRVREIVTEVNLSRFSRDVK